jgi:hypothetical protein
MIQSAGLVIRPRAGRLAITLVVSITMVMLAAALNAPIWLVGVLGLAPWLLPITDVVVATWRTAGAWLALYFVLALTQTGHVMEHVVQVTQLRILGLSGEHAHGVFGALDIEWVHFVWNAWVMVAVVALLLGRQRNLWLWIAAPLAAWHLLEHTVLIVLYLVTGTEGSPGLLAVGGLLANGVPLARPDLHLVYNLVETLPLLIGFGAAMSRRLALAAPGEIHGR